MVNDLININKEIKIKIDDPDKIIGKLRRKSAVLIGGVKETTTRYDSKEDKLEKSGQFIRTRTGFKNIISLKEKIDEEDENILARNDIEVEISNIKNIQYILEKIGLLPKYTMEKYRLKWIYNGKIINIDELVFGCYIEIHGNEEDIWRIFRELELEEKYIEKGTYWDIFERYKKENFINENIKDIIFPQGYSYKIAQ